MVSPDGRLYDLTDKVEYNVLASQLKVGDIVADAKGALKVNLPADSNYRFFYK